MNIEFFGEALFLGRGKVSRIRSRLGRAFALQLCGLSPFKYFVPGTAS